MSNIQMNVVSASHMLAARKRTHPRLADTAIASANDAAISHRTITKALPITSPHNTPTPLRTVHLHRTPHPQPHSRAPKQRRIRPRVNAQIEIDIRAVLVRPRQPRLRAQRVALRRTQVRHHHHDAVARVADAAPGAVGLNRELPARAAAGAGADALGMVLVVLVG